MIGNLSYEEHVRHFNDMYNHLKSKYQHLDVETIVETIRSKVMIVQEWENITYNLNIKDVHDTAMIKDFEKWTKRFYLYNNIDESGDLTQDDSQDDNLQDEEDDINDDDDDDLAGLKYYLRYGGEGDEGDDNDDEDDDDEEEDEDKEEEDEDEDDEDDDEDDEEDDDDEEDSPTQQELYIMRTKALDEESDIVDSEDEYLNEEGITPEERLRRQRVAKRFRRISQLSFYGESSPTYVNNRANLPPPPPEIPDDR